MSGGGASTHVQMEAANKLASAGVKMHLWNIDFSWYRGHNVSDVSPGDHLSPSTGGGIDMGGDSPHR